MEFENDLTEVLLSKALQSSFLELGLEIVIILFPPLSLLPGPLMNVCSDCKLMVCNIIRASRAMLAISQRGRQAYLPEASDRPGVTRHPKHLDAADAAVDSASARDKAKLHLDLQPIY